MSRTLPKHLLTLSRAIAGALLVLAGLVPIASSAETQQAAEVVLGNFESTTDPWTVVTESDAVGTVTQTTDDAREGTGSARLDVEMPNGIVELVRGFPAIDAQSVRFSLRSADLSAIVVRATESSGEVHQQRLDLDPTVDGWQDLRVDDLGSGLGHIAFGGDGDGTWQGPLTRISFLVDYFRLVNGPTGTILLDSVVAELPETAGPSLTIEPVVIGNAFDAGQRVEIGFSSTAEEIAWSVHDALGASVETGSAAVADLDGRIPLNVGAVGWYAVDLVATDSAGVVTTGGTDFSVLEPFDLGASNDRRIGVSTHYGQSWDPTTIPLIARAGFSSARDEAYWAQQETTPGMFDWTPKVEAYADAFEANDVDFLDILAYGNPLYHEGEAPATQQGWDAYAQYALASIERFGVDDTIYELWNEWNWRDLNGPAGGKAENYFGLVRTTSEAVRAEHPDAYLVGGALAPINDWQAWVQKFIDLGGLDYVDAFSTHPYVYPGDPEGYVNHLETLRGMMSAAGHGDMPILMTEHGWPTGSAPRAVSEPAQARNLTRSQLLAIANGVQRYTTYDFKDDGTNPAEVEHRFGIIRNEADPRGAYTPKPAYVANGVLTRTIADKPFLRDETPASGVHDVVLNAGNGREVHAAWTAEGADVTTLAFAATGDVTITDLYGAEHVLTPGADGAVHVSIGPDPVYVAGTITGVDVSSTYALETKGGAVGSAVPAQWVVDNSGGSAALKVVLDAGEEAVRAHVKPGERSAIDVQLPAPAAAGERVWPAIVRSGKSAVAYLTTRAQVVEAISLTGRHAQLSDGSDVLRVRARNNAAVAAELEVVQVDIDGEITTGLEGQTLEPGGVASLDVPVTVTGDTPWSATAVGASTATASGTLRAATDIHDVPEASVDVDGTIDEAVAGLDPVVLTEVSEPEIDEWGGADDLSGRLWVTHDDEALYLSAEIKDDVHSQPARAADVWRGDSLQIGASAGVAGESKTVHEVGTALTDAGAVDVARWLPADVAPDTSGIRSAVARDDATATTQYELAISWDAIGVHAEDRLLAITAVFNENDGADRRGWFSWGKGVAESKDGSLFNTLRLMPAADGA